MKLALSRMHFPVTQLGPGKRIGIWFQGCSIACVGCISVDTWVPNKNKIPLTEVYSLLELWLPKAEGITISGGEPFDQPGALNELLAYLKQRSSLDIMVYSGYSMELLQQKAASLIKLIDVLITDPFDRNQSQSKPWVGSDNQRVYFSSKKAYERFSNAEKSYQSLGFTVNNQQMWMIGVPYQQDLAALKNKLTKSGHDISTSQDTRIIARELP